MWIELAKHQSDNAYAVTWERQAGRNVFRVTYGTSQHEFRGHKADIASSREFGECVRHAAECNGLLD